MKYNKRYMRQYKNRRNTTPFLIVNSFKTAYTSTNNFTNQLSFYNF
nr:MAG TPA: hypothetical protein [Caudoviricetes sp.]